ncbi:MAG: alpha-E domain-containing protein [Gordonia sp. (in: high G+C Gram-positive bacteria)]|uniref:alpha-E domain-containing protein n=1 Tax=Gordonia sp. (in: high G+C Gram-positive bacteria) TaxID=84139 RepID=UPI0039E39DA7
MMLARNADSLYWIGRYVERADDMARILDVAVQQLLEDATVDTDSMVRHVMAVLGFDPGSDAPQTVWSLVDAVAYDRDSHESIVGLIETARQNARGAREVISSEMWECLNATYMGLDDAERRARLLGPHAFLTQVKERAAMFAGLTDSTLSHDDGYSYLIVGRSIERVDMTVRLLMSRSAYRRDALSWMSLLVAAGGQDTYIRAYRGAVETENVVEFMMLDRLFPRSVFNSLCVAERYLAELDNRPDRVGSQSTALTLLGRARSSLEFIGRAEMVRDLPTYLADLQETCRAVSESIAEEHFHIEPYVSWTDTGLADITEIDDPGDDS